MRRRDFLGVLGGAAALRPLAARAQQPGGMRRIAVLSSIGDTPDAQARYAAFLKELQHFGWNEGGNIRIDARHPAAIAISSVRSWQSWSRLRPTLS